MTPREREIFFNGLIAGAACAVSGRLGYVFDKVLDAWKVDPDPQKAAVFKEIHAELIAIGVAEEEEG